MKQYLYIFICVCCVAISANAQELSARMASTPHTLDTAATRQLGVDVDAIAFFKDNEFEGEQAKGYSLPGVWIQPRLTYQPLDMLRLEAGFHALIFYGANKYPCYAYHDIATWKGNQYQRGAHVLPFFRAQAQVGRAQFVLGNIFGGVNHNLIEPLMNPEVNLTQDPEMGAQILLDLPRYQMDAWINWQSYIFELDTHQEAFTVGLSQRISLNPNPSTLNSKPSARSSASLDPSRTLNSNPSARSSASLDPSRTLNSQPSTLNSKPSTLNSKPSSLNSQLSTLNFYIPIHLLAQHRGGEQDTTSLGVQTLINASVGVHLDWNTGCRVLRRLGAEANILGCWQQSGELWPFDTGIAGHFAVDAELGREFRVFASILAARNFVSLYGAPFYNTISQKHEGGRFARVITPHIGAEWRHTFAKMFVLGAKADIYPMHAGRLSLADGTTRPATFANNFSFGLYLRVNPHFLLKRFR